MYADVHFTFVLVALDNHFEFALVLQMCCGCVELTPSLRPQRLRPTIPLVA